ncbi:cation diffusion facilitator family transporter (plasmid) [Rubrobacter tropicus]|uniref:Cation diffusion facilitator family transporter n=1 Tax=Rubrobacter tropicus TaxID=2653851 RepID=A0A6G8QFX4_9ACTN|nr:cation diffusion facilitator family transporter [Rubrobacter tropicus]QIN85370.1 cation diffusion facilitator family transporter [Rubrobacter tropicus]
MAHSHPHEDHRHPHSDEQHGHGGRPQNGGGGHSHDGHSHGNADRRALAVVFGLTTTFLVVEVIGGLLTGSLALLADAGHMASDSASIGLALFAFWLSAKPATPNRSFGYKRAEILAALFNGMTLVAISIWIFVEAYRRLQEPPEILGGWMLAVAVLGLVINAAGAAILMRSGGESLNLQGALRHVIADVMGSVGAIAASLVIILTGWVYADPIISALIGLLVLGSSWKLLKESVNVLLEQAPRGIDAEAVGRKMVEVEGVVEVHDLHVWTITSGFPALAAHVLVGNEVDCHERRREIEKVLSGEFGIEHTTLQVDHVGDHGPEGEGRRLEFLPRGEEGGAAPFRPGH